MTNENKIVTPFPEDNELLGTWVFNDSIESLRSATFNIRFESKSTKYNTIEWQSFDMLYKIDYSETIVCSRGVWTDNAYKTIKITDIQNLTNSDEFLTWLSSNATKQETPPTQVSNKAISLENLKTFKQECDKVYASKDEIITATVDCSHQYEITGNTGDEHGLAIEDQQMLINKIQGHSRRKSLNLMQDKNESVGSVQFSISKSVLTINGTTNSDTTWFGIPVDYLPTNFVFSTFNTSAVNDCDILFMRGGTPIDYISNLPKNSVKKLSNIESISIRLNGNGKTFSNVKIPIMINEGTTALPFQPYDNTLVNSNNTLISTGRNLVDVIIPTINASEWKYLETTTLLKGRYFVKVESDNNEGSCLINIGSFEVYPSGIKYNTAYWFDVKGSGAQGQIQFYSNTANTNVKVQIRYTPTGNVNFDFEPYKQDLIQAPMLGEFDYYQEGKIYRQTSQIITLNGSEEWNLNESAPNKQRFVTYPKIQTIDTSSEINLVANNLTPTTTAEIWINTEKNNLIGAQNTRVEIVKREFTTTAQLKQWLAQNPIQLVYKLNTQTIEEYTLPSGMAVYNGGLQIQQGDLPYTITKQYNLSQKAQILANIEIDREQAKMIDELNNKIVNLPSPSITNRKVKNISINNTFPQTLTPEQTKDVFNNNLFVILSVGGSQNFYEYTNVIENPSEGKTFINISPGMKDYVSENVSFGVLYISSNGYIRKENFQINKFPVYQHSILITDEKETRILCSIVAKKSRTISTIAELKYLINASGLKIVCNGFVKQTLNYQGGMAFELNTQSGNVKVKYITNNSINDVELNSISGLKIIDAVYDYTEANG